MSKTPTFHNVIAFHIFDRSVNYQLNYLSTSGPKQASLSLLHKYQTQAQLQLTNIIKQYLVVYCSKLKKTLDV